jgi:hypothetical protein
MNKLPPSVLIELIELRNILDAISQVSWSFSVLNKQYPIGGMTEEDVDVIRSEYLTLIDRTRALVANGNER